MKIGVAIATFNEGPDLEATIALAFASLHPPHVVCVVDDASETPLRNSTLYSGVYIRHHAERLGSGQTKASAVRMCMEYGCDAVVVLDAHMRMPYDWLTKIKETLEQRPDAIGCATCRGFETLAPFIASGATLSSHLLGPEPIWSNRGVEPIERVPSVLGACYFATTQTWKALDIFHPCFYGWGCEEATLSIKAWLSGREVVRRNDLVVQHRFDRRNEGFFLNSWHAQYNMMVMCATLFEDGVFERVYEPYMRASYDAAAVDRFTDKRESIAQERCIWRASVKHPDSYLEYVDGMHVWTHPTLPQQEQKLGLKKPSVPLNYARHPLVKEHIGIAHREQMLQHAVRHDKRILEWGAGGSTLFFRDNGIDTFTIEHDLIWAARVGKRVYILDAKTHHYADFAKTLGKFSTVLIDGMRRDDCLRVAANLLQEDGAVFLTNCRRDEGLQNTELFTWTDLGEDFDFPGNRVMMGTKKC